ncbi:2-acylglycerol O-acyltransferase 2 [Strongylocentrotus purpuratus]|uniref:Acyltransferase n=1 Tax=Strongylocentrotus purpuratus TaxID=7668 RepID=A0A7M7TG22_STRPU|nr:2-acylglycerol O-acyltransferase 2 [Strongylocentrotus purpuratus]|eukprot:XP_780610.3 PREDICTED: 2-acylglycerol O-acyltransferase 2-like isoform X2 [Strongylocentrotus purpuratus]
MLPKFAPLNTPLHRRLETGAVLIWWFIFLWFRFTVQIFLVALLFTRYFWVSFVLMGWAYYDRHTPKRGGRRSDFMRRGRIWKKMADYFPVHLVKTSDLDPNRNYLFGVHPHGIMSVGAFVNFAAEATSFSDLFPGIKSHLCTLSVMYTYPLARDLMMAGGMCDVHKESIDYLLGQSGPGNAAVIVVGGAGEALEARADNHVVCLKERKGFIKKALQHGAHLVPCYTFGENDLYHQLPSTEGSRTRWIQQQTTRFFGFSIPIFYGRGVFQYSFGFLPFRKELNTVVGKPISVEKMEKPSSEAIEDLWNTYIQALQELFEENKVKFGVRDDLTLQVK